MHETNPRTFKKKYGIVKNFGEKSKAFCCYLVPPLNDFNSFFLKKIFSSIRETT